MSGDDAAEAAQARQASTLSASSAIPAVPADLPTWLASLAETPGLAGRTAWSTEPPARLVDLSGPLREGRVGNTDVAEEPLDQPGQGPALPALQRLRLTQELETLPAAPH